MDWAAIQEATRAVVQACLEIPLATDVVWRKTNLGGTWKNSPRVFLKLRTRGQIGVDETRYEYNAETDENIPVQVGNRTWVVQVRIETETQVPGVDAGALASRLVTRIGRAQNRDTLRTARAVYLDCGPQLDVDYIMEGREIGCSQVEIRFSSLENEMDTVSSSDYINHVEVSSEYLKSPDGVNLPDALQMDETIPPLPVP